MTPTPLLDTAIHQLRQQHTVEAQVVDQITRLKIGRVLAAVVTEVSALTPAERRDALHKLEQYLASQTPSPAPPLRGLSDARAQLADWLQQPRLYLIELRAGSQEFYTITPETLRLQRAVKVLIRPDGQLQLLSQGDPAAKPKLPDVALAAKTSAENPPQQLTPAIRRIVADSLRQSLPQQASLTALLRVLAQLDTQLAPLPPELRTQIMPAKVAEALRQFQANSHTPEQLAQPDKLRQALRQSGVFLESALAARVGSPRAPVAEPTQTPSAPVAARESLRTLLQAAPSLPVEKTQPLPEADTKAALLQALHTLHAHRLASTAPAAARPLSSSESLIASLLGFLIRTPTQEKTFVEGRDQLLQQLQHQVAAALAKVQTQQLQSVSQRLGESAQPSQGGHFELPVRLADGYSSVAIHIQEHWRQEQHEQNTPEDERPAAQKVRQWEVFMEFDLNDDGVLAAQLKVVNNCVSASFWAQSAHMRALAHNQLTHLRQDMEASGLRVQDMQCLAGQPPKKTIKLNYNLVDIRT